MINDQIRMEVLATIDELNQYLNHNVTIEGAAAAARELAYNLDEHEIDETSKAFRDMEAMIRLTAAELRVLIDNITEY